MEGLRKFTVQITQVSSKFRTKRRGLRRLQRGPIVADKESKKGERKQV